MNERQVIQSLIIVLGGEIEADGIIGPLTKEALSKLMPHRQRIVLGLARKLDVEISDSIPLSEVEAMIADVSKQTRVSQKYLLMVVKLENVIKNGEVEIDTTPPFIGLGQFDKPAWSESSSRPYKEASNPIAALEAIAGYYLINRKRFNNDVPGGKYTDQIAYTYHNQGPTGAVDVLVKGIVTTKAYTGQSVDAKIVMQIATMDVQQLHL